MPGLLRLEDLLARYDDDKIATLVNQSHDRYNIRRLLDIIVERDPVNIRTLEKLGSEIYGGEWGNDLQEAQHTLENADRSLKRSDFADEMKSEIWKTLNERNREGNLDDILDAYVRSIIKHEITNLTKKDKLFQKFIKEAVKRCRQVRYKEEGETQDSTIEIWDPNESGATEKVIADQRQQIIFSSILKLPTDQQSIAFLSWIGFSSMQIADIWPEKPITNHEIQQKKQKMLAQLRSLVAKDPKYRQSKIN
jgi:hypothetical protein